jgi:hypothetical protein
VGDEADPYVTRDPPAWLEKGGASMAGMRLSECSREYLDVLAEAHQARITWLENHGRGNEADNNRRMLALAKQHAASKKHITRDAGEVIDRNKARAK